MPPYVPRSAKLTNSMSTRGARKKIPSAIQAGRRRVWAARPDLGEEPGLSGITASKILGFRRNRRHQSDELLADPRSCATGFQDVRSHVRPPGAKACFANTRRS